MSRIYKLLARSEWEQALAAGIFTGSGIDHRDGFIHLSTAEQLSETARLHFRNQPDLYLLELESEALGASLRWEPSRGGQLFPHHYGPIPVGVFLSARPFGPVPGSTE